MHFQPVLEPMKMGGLTISNCLIMAPMTRSAALNPVNKPTEFHVKYYCQRAAAALIITEGAQISKETTANKG
jgi:N-ethylmaleimide reductase